LLGVSVKPARGGGHGKAGHGHSAGVKRSSGSAVRLPITVIRVSPDIMLALRLNRYTTPERRPVLAPGGGRRLLPAPGEGAAPGRWRLAVNGKQQKISPASG
jgi:hypothetical protein